MLNLGPAILAEIRRGLHSPGLALCHTFWFHLSYMAEESCTSKGRQPCIGNHQGLYLLGSPRKLCAIVSLTFGFQVRHGIALCMHLASAAGLSGAFELQSRLWVLGL